MVEYWWGRDHILPATIGYHPGTTGMASSSLAAAKNLTMKLEPALSMTWRGPEKSVPILIFL